MRTEYPRRILTEAELTEIEERMLRDMAARYAAVLGRDRTGKNGRTDIMAEQKTAGQAVEQTVDLTPLELIQVDQVPKFTEQLHTIKEKWEAVAAECESLACTDETLQAVKARRSEVNKAFDLLESRRKAVKQVVITPYNQLEDVYRECVTAPYKKAVDALQKKISDAEDGIKGACEAKMRAYFSEICQREKVGNWLTWEMGGFKVSLTEARKKVPSQFMGQIADFVVRVGEDTKSIYGMDNAPEILDVYKRNGLNLAAAISAVSERHARIEAERQEAERREAAARMEREAVARVEQAAALAPPRVEAAPEKPAFPPEFRMVLYPNSVQQWDALRPLLYALKSLCDKEGIRYGK